MHPVHACSLASIHPAHTYWYQRGLQHQNVTPVSPDTHSRSKDDTFLEFHIRAARPSIQPWAWLAGGKWVLLWRDAKPCIFPHPRHARMLFSIAEGRRRVRPSGRLICQRSSDPRQIYTVFRAIVRRVSVIFISHAIKSSIPSMQYPDCARRLCHKRMACSIEPPLRYFQRSPRICSLAPASQVAVCGSGGLALLYVV